MNIRFAEAGKIKALNAIEIYNYIQKTVLKELENDSHGLQENWWMGQFDRVLKENIEAIFSPLLEKLLHLSIKETFEIKDKILTTIEREPDFLKRIIDKEGKEFILQLEFQTKNDPEMVYRMAEYKAILQRKYHLPVRQLVIYLGSTKPTMKTVLPEEEQIIGFELNNIHDFPTQVTLASDIPEEIILSILTDFKRADAGKVIEQVISKLRHATRSENELRRSIKQLLILSRLRNLEVRTKKKVSDMPITYNIEKDGLYREGIEKGIKSGAEKKQYRIISNALHQGILTIEQIAEMAEVDIDYVISVQSELKEKNT